MDIRGYRETPVVYLGKSTTSDEEDRFVVRIGHTKNVRKSAKYLRESSDSMDLVSAFRCERNLEFKRFLIRHVDAERFSSGERGTDSNRVEGTFIMSEEKLADILKIAENNVFQFQNLTKEEYEAAISRSIDNDPRMKRISEGIAMVKKKMEDDGLL